MKGSSTRLELVPIPWLAAVVVVLSAASAPAAVIHRYSFESDVGDSIGGAHGVVVDEGSISRHVFAGGQLHLTNTGQTSAQITEDAYVDLPNGLISSAVSSGTDGAVTLEFWFTVDTTRTWQMLGNFGHSNNGEDTSDIGSASDYVFVSPNSGRYSLGLETANHPASGAGEPTIGLDGPFPTGVERHVAVVYDHTDPSAGPNGTMRLFLDGALVPDPRELHPDIDLGSFADVNNWLGRSQWNDPLFDGSYNEFRIHDDALDPRDVDASFQAGPDVLPEPSAAPALLLGAGLTALLGRRTRPGRRLGIS